MRWFLYLAAFVAACAAFAAWRHAAASEIVTEVLVDSVNGTATLRLEDLAAIVQQHNAMVDEIARLKRMTGCI